MKTTRAASHVLKMPPMNTQTDPVAQVRIATLNKTVTLKYDLEITFVY